MGASNEDRANAIADWFARASSQASRMNEIATASKADVKRRKYEVAVGRRSLASSRKLAKAGIHYQHGKAPDQQLTAADTLHLINGKVVKGTANAGGVLDDSAGGQINNPSGTAPAMDKNQFIDTMSDDLRKNKLGFLGGGSGGVGDFIADAVKNVSKSTPLGDVQNYLFNNSDPLGRPQNAGQWVINALSTPLYAVAEGAHAVGEAAAENEAKGLKHDTSPLAPSGALGSIGTFLGGAGRGVAEGFGARFADNPTPRTLGSDLEELGTKEALQGALGKDAGNVAQGVLGGVADIAGDPSTWLTLGAGAAARGAITGAREARIAAKAAADAATGTTAKAAAEDAATLAERYAGKTPTPQQVAAAQKTLRPPVPAGESTAGTKFSGALSGARQEFGKAFLRPTFYNEAKVTATASNRELRKAIKTLNPEELTKLVGGHKEDWQDALLAAAARKKATGRAFGPEDTAEAAAGIPKGLTGVLNPEAADLRAAGISELLPKITSRGLDAEAALARSTTEGAGALLSDADHAALQTAIATASSPAAWQAAEKGLRTSAATKAFLDSTMTVGTREMKVAEVARKLATGDPLSPAYRRFQDALDGALTQAKGRAGTVSGPELASAIGDQGFDAGLATGDLVEKLNGVPHEARKAILQQILSGGKTYKTFDAAMNAAVSGQVDASMMRTMLAKLGIQTAARKPETLRKLLDGQGRTNWEQIKASVRTPQEVLDIHGIEDAAVAASAEVDLGKVLPEAQAAHEAATTAEYGYDPTKIAPLKQNGKIVGDSTGAAVWEAQQKLGTLFRKGEATEAYDNTAMREVHSAIMRELAQIGNVRGLSGVERAAYLLPRYRQATRTVEAGNLANGIMPRVVSDKEAVDPLFVSWGQIIDEIPDETLARALFSPDFERASFAAEKSEGFRKGLSAYPTVIADGVRAAIRGADPDTVATSMFMQHVGRSDTDKYINLRGIYEEVADVITEPAFLEKMRGLDAAQQPLAYRLSSAAAEGVVTPLSQRILAAINDAGDQGVTRNQIQKAIEESRRQAASAAGYPSLVSDMVQQRMDNGFVNGVLGEYGSLVLSAQERSIRASRVAGAANGGRKLTAQNKARVDTLDDFEPHIDASAGVGAGADAVEELANLETKWELMDGVTGIYRTTQRLGVALSGRYGMDGMKDVLTEGNTFAFATAADFNRGLREWIHGKRTGLSRQRLGGLTQKIAQDKGLSTPVPLETATAYTRDWWSALAAVPAGATEQEMIRLLRLGKRPRGLEPGVRGLEEWELPHAMRMKGFIDMVYDESDAGLFSRSGLSSADVVTEMKRYRTFREGGDFATALPVTGKGLEEQAHIWRAIDPANISPLDLLDQTFAAISAAGVKPGVGAQVSKLWGRYNPSADEIRQLGLKRLNTTGSQADLARFVDPNAYFTPGERRQLSYLQQAMNYSRDFPQGLQPIVRVYDAVTRVLKSSATVWRPGHHITNILGDMFMNVLAGVNPLHLIRAIKMMRTWGHMLDADLGPLAYLERTSRPIGRDVDLVPDARFGKDYIVVRVNGKAQPLSLEEAMSYAHRSGVAQTHSAVMDMAETGPGRVAGQRNLLQRAGAATIGRADNALGEFSMIRDNLTRLPHFITALERGNFKSLDEALHKAAAEVHDFHPTAQSGSGFEQKVMRRAFYFYTWTRQAASRVIRTGLDRPGLITIPSKIQYEMASANGLNPESIGVPFDDSNEDIPEYRRVQLLGPTYFGGLTPVPDPNGDTAWGYSLSTPQIDALQTLFSGANSSPGQTGLEGTGQQIAGGAVGLGLSNLNPLLRAPGVIPWGRDVGTFDPSASDGELVRKQDPTQWVAGQGGAATAAAKATGLWAQLFPGARDKNGVPYKSEEQNQADAQRSLLNALTGLKFSSYDDATSAAVAGKQRKDRELAAKRSN